MQPFERLRVIREHLGNSLPEFSSKLGYSNAGSYRNLEAGLDPISKILLKRLHEKFGVNPKYITEGEGEMFIIESKNIINQQIDYMNSNTLDKLLDIILKQRDDIRYSLETQRILANKLPNMEAQTPGGVRGEAV